MPGCTRHEPGNRPRTVPPGPLGDDRDGTNPRPAYYPTSGRNASQAPSVAASTTNPAAPRGGVCMRVDPRTLVPARFMTASTPADGALSGCAATSPAAPPPRSIHTWCRPSADTTTAPASRRGASPHSWSRCDGTIRRRSRPASPGTRGRGYGPASRRQRTRHFGPMIDHFNPAFEPVGSFDRLIIRCWRVT